MDYYVEYNEIPVFNLLKVFETNNYNWMYLGFHSDNVEYNYNLSLVDKKLENHFINIVGNFNHFNSRLWLLIIKYFGELHKLNESKGDIEFLKTIGFEIIEILILENRKIEEVLNCEIDLKKITVFDWLVLRENTI